MTIDTYLNHKQEVRFLALFLCVLIVISCMSVPAEGAALEIGISLIALILSGFGVVASTTGAIDGMNQGLERLMSEFSESQGKDSGWFRGLFNTDNITSKGYNRLGVGGVLVASIKLFVAWLRNNKGLSENQPLENQGITYISYLGNRFPLSNTFRTGDGYLHIENPIEVDAISQHLYDVNLQINGNNYTDISITHKNNNYYITLTGSNILDLFVNPINGKIRYGFTVTNYYQYQYLTLNCVTDYRNGSYTVNDIYISDMTQDIEIEETSSWQIDDNNLDTSYLENEDDSTKDVIFTPAYPADMPLDDLDLGTIGGMEDAAGRTYDYSKSETGTAVGEGKITTDTNLQPGDNEVPDISIPSGGFFSTIWHYVVEALQVSKDGISFILNVVNTVIPSSILTLCWASCVLLIVFGILNKFLK